MESLQENHECQRDKRRRRKGKTNIKAGGKLGLGKRQAKEEERKDAYKGWRKIKTR